MSDSVFIPGYATHDWVAASAVRVPEAPAIIHEGRTFTYRELNALVAQAAAWLASVGVRHGARVGLYTNAGIHAAVVIHALVRLGAVVVPFNRRLSTSELAYQTTFVELVVHDESWTLPFEKSYVMFDYTKFPGEPVPAIVLGMNAVQTLIFTSGTTGKPKAARLTYGNHYYSAVAAAQVAGLGADDRWLLCMSLYHIGGLAILLRCALLGICAILHDGFDLERVNRSLDHDGATQVSLVPTMLYRLLDSRATPPRDLRMCLIGGAAATPELVRRAQSAGFPVATTYGMTETASQIATQMPAETMRKPGSVGKPVPFTQIWIEGDNGAKLSPGDVGEIVVSGPTVTPGYEGDPASTTTALRNGGFHTGDLGYVDGDGDLWLVQRRSDFIVSGGENVYPAEVEAALRTHPGVRDACVVGVPHPEWGQQVAALVVADSQLPLDELTSFLRGSLAGYKLPRIVRYTDALPMTGSGKVERRTVAAMFDDSNKTSDIETTGRATPAPQNRL